MNTDEAQNILDVWNKANSGMSATFVSVDDNLVLQVIIPKRYAKDRGQSHASIHGAVHNIQVASLLMTLSSFDWRFSLSGCSGPYIGGGYIVEYVLVSGVQK